MSMRLASSRIIFKGRGPSALAKPRLYQLQGIALQQRGPNSFRSFTVTRGNLKSDLDSANAEQVKGKVKQKASEWADAGKKNAQSAEESGHETAEAARERADSAQKKASEAAESTKESIKSTAAKAEKAAENAAESTKEFTRKSAQKTKEFFVGKDKK